MKPKNKPAFASKQAVYKIIEVAWGVIPSFGFFRSLHEWKRYKGRLLCINRCLLGGKRYENHLKNRLL